MKGKEGKSILPPSERSQCLQDSQNDGLASPHSWEVSAVHCGALDLAHSHCQLCSGALEMVRPGVESQLHYLVPL